MKFDSIPCPVYSPWGPVQHSTENGPGLWTVSTASHGGLYMSPQRLAVFRDLFPTFQGYAGLPWLEEDCDYCLGVLAFHDCFPAEMVFYSVRMVRHFVNAIGNMPDTFAEVRAWLLTPAARHVVQIADDYALTRLNLWEAGSMGSFGEGWSVSVSRGDGPTAERATLLLPSYPLQHWFTDAEVRQYRKPQLPDHARERLQAKVQAVLGEQRAPHEFNEADCGGAFDGHQVISDADPGL